MSSIHFEKVEYANLACFKCKDSGWNLSKELGFYKGSPSRDYLVKWKEIDGRWVLYLSHYDDIELKNEFTKKIIITVDTIFDVIDYISKNKMLHYS